MRRAVAALGAAVDPLAGVKPLGVLLQLHGVKRDKGAKVAGELLAAGVATPQVPQEDGLVGGAEVALRAVVGLVRPVVRLHVGPAGEQSSAGVMATAAGRCAVRLRRMSHKLLSHARLEGAAALEARQRLPLLPPVVGLHVRLEGPGEQEALPAGGTRVAASVARHSPLSVDVGEVAAHGARLHRRVLAQVTAVAPVARLAQLVHAQLALAGEEALTGRTLEAGVRVVHVQVLL